MVPGAAYTAYCGARVYSSQKGVAKEDEELSSVPVLLKAGLSLETQWAFMQLGIPGGLMMAAEASSYDVTTALAGLLGAAQKPPNVICCWSTEAQCITLIMTSSWNCNESHPSQNFHQNI